MPGAVGLPASGRAWWPSGWEWCLQKFVESRPVPQDRLEPRDQLWAGGD